MKTICILTLMILAIGSFSKTYHHTIHDLVESSHADSNESNEEVEGECEDGESFYHDTTLKLIVDILSPQNEYKENRGNSLEVYQRFFKPPQNS